MHDRHVLLFSGGLDSFVIARLLNPDVALYIDLGLPDNLVEMAAIRRIAKDVPDFPSIEVVENVLDLTRYELKNKIVPGRNAMLALVAANHGNKIILGATAGDTTHDKDQGWAGRTSLLLTHMFDQPGDAAKRPNERWGEYQIEVPFRTHTKAGLVREYLSRGYAAGDLLLTRSCYRYGENLARIGPDAAAECGVCRSCFRKWVALKVNGVPTDGHFIENPMVYAAEHYAYALERGRASELADISAAVKELGYDVSDL